MYGLAYDRGYLPRQSRTIPSFFSAHPVRQRVLNTHASTGTKFVYIKLISDVYCRCTRKASELLAWSGSTVTTCLRHSTYPSQSVGCLGEVEAAQAKLPRASPAEYRLDVGRRVVLWISRPTAANAAIRDVLDSNLTVLFDAPSHTWEGSTA